MRCYTFTNMYLSSLQNGIQSAHCVAELFNRYRYSSATEVGDILHNWSENYKTMILLNGGYDSTLKDLFGFLDSGENPYPFTNFHESNEAMDGMMTSVVVVLPEIIYETAARLRKCRRGWDELVVAKFDNGGITVLQPKSLQSDKPRDLYWELSPWEMELIERLNTFGLAR